MVIFVDAVLAVSFAVSTVGAAKLILQAWTWF
jgi:hypothetical protein